MKFEDGNGHGKCIKRNISWHERKCKKYNSRGSYQRKKEIVKMLLSKLNFQSTEEPLGMKKRSPLLLASLHLLPINYSLMSLNFLKQEAHGSFLGCCFGKNEQIMYSDTVPYTNLALQGFCTPIYRH